MELLNEINQPNSNIDLYLDNLETVFNQQVEKINFMKMRINNFKKLLNEESLLSQRIQQQNSK